MYVMLVKIAGDNNKRCERSHSITECFTQPNLGLELTVFDWILILLSSIPGTAFMVQHEPCIIRQLDAKLVQKYPVPEDTSSFLVAGHL